MPQPWVTFLPVDGRRGSASRLNVQSNKEHTMKTRITILAMLLLAGASTEALAQGRGGRGGPGGRFGGVTELGLLNVEAVQKELELLDDQIAQIRDLGDKLRGQRGDGDRPNFQDMTDEERQQFFEQRRKEAEETAQKAKTELKTILLDDQLARLQQIFVQVAGTQALTDADVAAKLGLSDDQKTKIAAARQEAQSNMREQMRELFQSDNREAAQAKIAELRKAADEKVLALLTDQQKQDFEALKGTPFEMPEGALFGGRGGFGGRRGGGGGGGDRPQRPE
jgi:Spy/CpxP family protein refolding chaperone